ncbi:MAG: hypothetical protein ACI35S_06930 [Anaeroplasma sp.]
MKRFVSLFKNNAFKVTLCICLFLSSTIIIVAMLLGNEAGSFVIRVQDGQYKRSIAITEDIEDTTSYASKLSTPGFTNFTDYSPKFFLQGGYETINEYTKNGGVYAHKSEGGGISLYCYTFYIVNTSQDGSSVNVNVSMDYSNVTNYLDEIVRVMTYYTNDQGQEVANIYQKADTDKVEYIHYNVVPPQAFSNNRQVYDDESIYVDYQSYVKYSVVFWLEGDDPDSNKYGSLLYSGTIKFALNLEVAMEG